MDKPANFKMFRLVEIDEFDARRGYRRCDPPGIGVHMGGDGPNPEAEADFWRDRAGWASRSVLKPGIPIALHRKADRWRPSS